MSSSDGETGGGEPRGRRSKGSPLLVLAAGLLMFAAIVGATFILLRPTTLRIAVGPSGSTDQQLIQGLAQHFAQENGAVRLSVITTAGPVDSIAVLAAGNADLAVARADEEMPDGTEAVAILRKNVVVLWAASSAPPKAPRKPAKSRIKAIGDLPGHRVGVVGRTKVNVTLLRVILKESGVDPDKVEVAQFGNDQVTDMVKDAGVDAFMLVGPVDSKLTAEAISTSAHIRGEPVFLPIDVSEAIAARHAAYESEEIPGSSFTTSPARPDDKVETVSINHLVVAPKSLSEVTVGSLTRQIFATKPSLAREIPSASRIEKPDTDKDAALPAHPGAAAYIDGTERTFMDRYSDYIWGVVLLFSVLGSATAAFRHFIRRDERKMNVLHRDRLVDAITRARQINSLEELDALQCEADEILRETLECFDDGAIDESDLAAYRLVLEQFHHAVVDRRAALGGTSVNLGRMRAG
ncbi:MAG TPA: TAXI family TRAP transporter solute-binding subunit [Bradyrhizobium sp.]